MLTLLLAAVIEFQVVRLREPNAPSFKTIQTTFVGVKEIFRYTNKSPSIYRYIETRGSYRKYNTIVPKMYYARYLAQKDKILRVFPTRRPTLIVSPRSLDGYMYGFATYEERVAMVAGSVVNLAGANRREHLKTLYAHEIAHLFKAKHTKLKSCDVMDPDALVCPNQPLSFAASSIREINR